MASLFYPVPALPVFSRWVPGRFKQEIMLTDILKAASSFEALGIVGFLVSALFLSVWVIRFLYKEKEACAKDRLENTEAIGELKGDVRALNAELEGQKFAREEHKKDMQNLHQGVLQAVIEAGRVNRSN